ncbi:MAG: hypothetical protein ACNI28_12510 [Arcobacter sp.]|uniref:hypothetical protein n=1 Tax=Arcobacter sp. TaxID=1872629 RepID=UPI003AFF860F
MKKTLALSALLALTTSSMAMDVEYFIGAGAERGKLDTTVSGGNLSIGNKYNDTAFKLKAGAIIDKKHRVSLSRVGYSEKGGDFDLTNLNYDYIIPLKNDFSLLAGVHAGVAEYDEPGYNIDGFDYGLQAGVLYDITSNVQLETNLAYTKFNVEETFSGVKAEFNDGISFYLGFNYKF